MMNKISVPAAMVSPNLAPKEKQNQGVLERQKETTERHYDALVARKETFITPTGKTGKTVIFSRATPIQLQAEDAERRLGSGALAKSLIERNVKRMKLDPDKKEQLLDLMRVRIKGQLKSSSDTHLSVEAVRRQGRHQDINALPIARQVRFVDSSNSVIPNRLPSPTESSRWQPITTAGDLPSTDSDS